MKKKLLISAISLAMAGMPTFQASAISLNPFKNTSEEISKDFKDSKKSATAAAKDFKDSKKSATAAANDAFNGVASTFSRVTKHLTNAINSSCSGVDKLMNTPVIQQHETMFTCGAAGGAAGFMARYLRAKTRFSKEVNLKGMQKLLYRAKGGGIGAKAALLAGLFLLEPQVQKQTALQRTSEEKWRAGYKATVFGFAAGMIV